MPLDLLPNTFMRAPGESIGTLEGVLGSALCGGEFGFRRPPDGEPADRVTAAAGRTFVARGGLVVEVHAAGALQQVAFRLVQLSAGGGEVFGRRAGRVCGRQDDRTEEGRAA